LKKGRSMGGQQQEKEKTRMCLQDGCRRICPESKAFCTYHKWTPIRPHPQVTKDTAGGRGYERRTEDGRLSALVSNTEEDGWYMTITHYSSMVDGKDGTHLINRSPSLFEIKDARYTLLPDKEAHMAIVLPPMSKIGREAPSMVHLWELKMDNEEEPEEGGGGLII